MKIAPTYSYKHMSFDNFSFNVGILSFNIPLKPNITELSAYFKILSHLSSKARLLTHRLTLVGNLTNIEEGSYIILEFVLSLIQSCKIQLT
jgi:hypothetical protein